MSVKNSEKPNVLYIDDEKPNLTGFKYMFRQYYNIYLANSADEGYEILEKERIDIIIADQRMPRETGVEFFHRILPRYPDSIRMLLTGYSDIEAVIDAINKGRIFYYFRKPWKEEEVRLVIAKALEFCELKKKLEESEKRFRDVSFIMADLIWETDIEGCCTYISGKVKQILGYEPEEIIGRTVFDLMHKEDAERMKPLFFQCLKEKHRITDTQARIFSKDGKSVLHLISGLPIQDKDEKAVGFRGIGKDITESIRAKEEKERLESMLRQSHKMEAIGTLAGGIAHDFNNILTPIIGYTEILMMETRDQEKLQEWTKVILNAGLRARDLVKQILTFSRQTEQIRKPLQIQPIIKEALKFLRASLPSTIEIRSAIDENCGLVLADPTRIYQIIVNLCTNAFHAMREPGGILEISLRETVLVPEDMSRFVEVEPGPYLRLSVSDTGIGMSPEILSRIFEPYFSTKAPGEGTGLGLSVVHGIVKDCGGCIKVYSEPGKGSVFNVYLPRLEMFPETATPDEEEDVPGGTESILLLDDEEELRKIMRLVLENLGYRVTVFGDGADALQELKNTPEKYDLLISDMTMPGMTGLQLAKEVLKILPAMPIILCTGFSGQFSRNSRLPPGISGIIRKPPVKKEIALTVREVMDQKKGA
ncbi:MAG: response regulator [Desulfococcaceae bacterium]